MRSSGRPVFTGRDCLMHYLRGEASVCPGSRQPMIEHVGTATFQASVVIATHGPNRPRLAPTPCMHMPEPTVSRGGTRMGPRQLYGM